MKKSKNKSVKKSSNSKNLSSKSKISNKKEVQNKIQKDNSKLKTFFNKNKPFIIGSIIFLVLLLILLAVQFNSTGKVITGYGGQGSTVNAQSDKGVPVDWAKTFGMDTSNNRLNHVFPTIFRWIFGQPYKIEGVEDVSVLILTIAIWLLVFLTFADIISTFSSFKKWISWTIGFLIAIMMAQFNFQIRFILFLSKVFTMTASTAVFVGLGGAFFAFLVVNLGLWNFRKWILHRKYLMIANKADVGAKSASDAITHLGEIETAFAKTGSDTIKKTEKIGI
jgi:hypothetical protein